MRKLITAPALLSVALLVACAEISDTPTTPGDPNGLNQPVSSAQAMAYVPGQLLVRFRDQAPVAELLRAEGAQVARELGQDIDVLDVPVGREEAIAAELARNPLVEFAEPNYIYTVDVPCETGDCVAPNDGFFGYKWDLHNDGTITNSQGADLAPTGLADADMDWLEAFDAIGPLTGPAIIGIMDTGILATHEDLAGKVVAGFDFFANDPDPADDNGHGTHVAGIAAGSGNNGTGVPGVAWMPEVQVAAAKVCGLILGLFYGCPSDAIANGVTWAVDNGANVINLSLGGGSPSAAVQSAFQYARANGVLPVCAAGNDSGAVSFPGAFPECMAVSSTDWSDGLASYSNFGPEVQVAAPGGDFENPNAYSQILSSYYSSNTSYAWLAGTSMASPQVAGLAGLLHALGVTDDDDKVARIRATADDLGAPGDDDLFGAGRINALEAVADLVGPPGNRVPIASFTYLCTELSCDFTDGSSDSDGAVVAWLWDFGDASGSSQQSPSHTYAVAGTYPVTLTVTDNEGATGSFGVDVTVPTPNQLPTASFTSSCTALDCAFTDASSDPDGAVVAWQWDFGDGNGSTAQSPSHSYTAGGTYTVLLTVTDDDGATGDFSADVTVEGPNQPPTASFTSDCTDLTCVFTDASTDPDGSIVTYQWTFGDGVSTNAQSPTHTYGVAGTYTVTLSIFDDDGANATSSADVTVTGQNQAPSASYTFACTDLSCDFTDTSTDPDGSIASWEWDFGDGTTSTEQNPSHTFPTPNMYSVTLTATDGQGATSSYNLGVMVPPPNQAPNASFTYSCTVFDCVFTDASTDSDGTVVGWDWDFGDGSTSTLQSPSHTFPASGSFTVSLTATDDGGATGTFSTTVTVEGPNQPPTASFSYSCTDLSCAFTDESSDPDGSVVTYQWTFGDGVSTNAQSPTHAYDAGGTYTVTLSIFDDDGATDSFSDQVTVVDPNQPPSAAFTSSCTDLSCAFTDGSSDADGAVVGWNWGFGDGGSSTAQSPSHTYGADGTYTVTLTVTDDDGATDSFSADVTVALANQLPNASFTSSCTDLDCVFTDASSDPDGAVVGWDWDFGDGSSSTAQSPSHTYGAAGTYTVALTVTDDEGATGTVSAGVTVEAPNQGPSASFTSSCTDLTCAFTDASADPDGSVVTWQWSFGDGVSTNAQNPSHTYQTGGTYTVSLQVSDNDGATDSFSAQVTVVDPNQLPNASFTSSCTDLDCVFTDASSDPDGAVVGWDWDFGDGASSTAQSPSHSYGAGGTYTVTLTVTDDDGATGSFSADVTVALANQLPNASFTSSCTDLDCVFTDASSDPDGAVVGWDWDFGDGSSSTAQSPSHSYGAAGTYTVTLTVTDDGGATDTFSTGVTVEAPNQAPSASFTSSCTDLTCAFTDASSDPDGSVVTWQWSFGDGVSTNAQNPSHTYATGGTYTVSLQVVDNDGATDSFSAQVTVPQSNQAPSASYTFECTGLDCVFTDTSFDWDGTVVSWSWDFGDGNGSTEQSPAHTFATAGWWSVTLIATDDQGGSASYNLLVIVP